MKGQSAPVHNAVLVCDLFFIKNLHFASRKILCFPLESTLDTNFDTAAIINNSSKPVVKHIFIELLNVTS